ncbi:MAG TPA: type II toxin-antitoxin system RelE/ParE family toxin [Pyrinomonadaceae bacterium]|nr:type II toxin-antitoxin system RelE/ParE family toxin [Pyrinomonadaceae bacterium]
MKQIVWTDPAIEDLRELHAYIARDSELYASGFVERLISATERLADHAEMGRVVPESNNDSIRELLYQNYRIIYRLKDDHVEVLSVLHGARDLSGRPAAPWEVS